MADISNVLMTEQMVEPLQISRHFARDNATLSCHKECRNFNSPRHFAPIRAWWSENLAGGDTGLKSSVDKMADQFFRTVWVFVARFIEQIISRRLEQLKVFLTDPTFVDITLHLRIEEGWIYENDRPYGRTKLAGCHRSRHAAH